MTPSEPKLKHLSKTLICLLLAALSLPVTVAMAATSPPRDKALDLGKRERLRVVLIGDTGMDNKEMRALRNVIKAEKKDVIIALGDLVYPETPACHSGLLHPGARGILDKGIGKTLLGLGAPVLLVLGNHDVAHGRRDLPREACILHYAALHEELVMPSLDWVLDAGVVSIVGLNTNALDQGQAKRARRALDASQGWVIFAGHHVLKTYHDKESEDVLKPWLKANKLKPDVYVNGHAHLLQAGRYWGILALTSGSAALPRERPECPPGCQPGQSFGSSASGYTLLDISPEALELSFYDNTGKRLHREVHTKSLKRAPKKADGEGQ